MNAGGESIVVRYALPHVYRCVRAEKRVSGRRDVCGHEVRLRTRRDTPDARGRPSATRRECARVNANTPQVLRNRKGVKRRCPLGVARFASTRIRRERQRRTSVRFNASVSPFGEGARGGKFCHKVER